MNGGEFGALNWVKGALDENIRQARQALEAHIEESGQGEALVRCADYLHEIAGVLRMVQVYGPGMLAEEMELVVRAMEEGRVRQQQDAAEALMLALIQLPDYLETLQAGEADVPLIILPLLNDLRAVRDAPLLSEAALFEPRIGEARVADRITGEPNSRLPGLARSLRQKFHLNLLRWYRQQQSEAAWQGLRQIFTELEQHAGTQQVHQLAWVTGALMCGLLEGSITPGIAVKQLFSKIDRQLKRIIDGGEALLIAEPPDDLLKNLLYYIAQADSSDPRILEVKQAFELEAVLPSEAELAQGRQGLSGSNAELAASINEAIRSELTRVKDVLDLFMRDLQAAHNRGSGGLEGEKTSPPGPDRPAELEVLGHLEQPLRKLADTLGMIGQGALRARLQRQADRVASILQRSNPPEEFELMEMAGDILYVESSLGSLQSVQARPRQTDETEAGWNLSLPSGEYQKLLKQAVREAKVEIARAKEGIITYTETHEAALLKAVHAGLKRVHGALHLLELADAARVLEATAAFIKRCWIDGGEDPDRQQLNSLADVISSIEYFLEALVDGAGDRSEIIAIAENALRGLLQAPQEAPPEPLDAEVIPLEVEAGQLEGPVAAATPEPGEASAAQAEETPLASADKPALEGIDPEILEIFIEEAREELENIQQDLPAWRNNQENKDALISFRRSFHTLKGSGRLVGAKVIGELAWSVENMLNRVLDETIKVSPAMLELLDDVLLLLPDLIDRQEQGISPSQDIDGLMQRAFALAEGREYQAGEQTAPEGPTGENPLGEPPAAVTAPAADESLVQAEPEHPDTGPVEVEFTDSDLAIELDSELLDVFSEEAEDHLEALETFVAEARGADPRPAIPESLVRASHTLHGSARMAGILPIADLAKSVEEYLKSLSEHDRLAEDQVLDLLDGAVIQVRKLLKRLSEEALAGEVDSNSYLTTLEATQDAVQREAQTEQGPAPFVEPAEAEPLPLEAAQSEPLIAVDEDPELLEIFLEEAAELRDSIHHAFASWQQAPQDHSHLEEMQHALHTLKGSARLAGITPTGDLSQALEQLCGALQDERLEPGEVLISDCQEALATLDRQLQEIESGAVHRPEALLARLQGLLEPGAGAAAEAARPTLEQPSLEAQMGEREEMEDLSSYYAEPLGLSEVDESCLVGEDTQLLEVFIEEARGLLETLDTNLREWSSQHDPETHLEEIQRTLHTLKGGARLAGILPAGDLSAALEGLFNRLAETQGGPDEPLLALVREGQETLARQVDEAESMGQVHLADDLIARLEALEPPPPHPPQESELQGPDEPSVPEQPVEVLEQEAAEGFYSDPLNLLSDDDLVEVGEDPELIEVFIEEAREFMERLESSYQGWSVNPRDHDLSDSMQRSLHTLKGSARLAGIGPVGDLSHALESLLSRVMEGELEADKELLRRVRQALDKLANQLDEIASTGKVSRAESLVQRLASLGQETPPEEASAQADTDKGRPETGAQTETPPKAGESAVVLPFVSEVAKRAKPSKQSAQASFKPNKDQVRINADLMDRLVNDAGEVSIYRARLEQQNSLLGFNLTEMEQTVARLHNQLRNLEMETEAQILYRWERDSEKGGRDKTDFDPLELDRFSTMQQLSRALMETVNDLGNINESLSDLQRETDTLLLQQSRISTDLQDGLLRTRMVPFVQLVPRMQRLVRQTADQLKKQARLECYGSEGELDRNILNRMIPVLEHLLRNAVSHGIESREERLAAGKDEMGRISLYIDREATDVLITLSDDGRGLDMQAIRRQAITQGLLKEGVEISDEDLMQCVLTPGFTTAKEVTQIAGRGVGLDVVASEVKQLGGGLEIESQAGRGTSFTIRLPLTLAISDALLVRVGEEVYAIPHGAVEGVVRIKRPELQSCYAGERQGYNYAGRTYRTAYLGSMMGVSETELSESAKWFPLLLVHTGKHQAALQVDELVGTRQVVVKSVGKQVGSVRWITGGTILADGRVALILDVGALVRMDAANLPSVVPTGDALHRKAEERVRVMVVDDSITVRKVTGRLLERNNMEVVTAKDGVEAVALLQEQVPDIMLLDIEMPRMDGFELARHINNSVDYYGLPIIMISSRVGEKHRQRAYDLGVKRCLGKPYQEAELLENIRDVLTESRG